MDKGTYLVHYVKADLFWICETSPQREPVFLFFGGGYKVNFSAYVDSVGTEICDGVWMHTVACGENGLCKILDEIQG